MESIAYTMIKLVQMVFKEVIFVHNTKFRSNGLELGHMVLKGVNWVHNDKLGYMVLKGVNWVHNM